MSTTPRLPVNAQHYPLLHAPELIRDATKEQLRQEIRDIAKLRGQIKQAYRMNHSSPGFLEELARLRREYGIESPLDRWYPGARPGRDWWRAVLTQMHIKLAELRGKVHGPALLATSAS